MLGFQVTVPIAEAGSVLHLELEVVGTFTAHSVTVSLQLVHLDDDDDNESNHPDAIWGKITPIMGKRVVNSLTQKFVIENRGEVKIILENKRSSWTKRKISLNAMVRAPSTVFRSKQQLSNQAWSLGRPSLAVLKLQVVDMSGPLAKEGSWVGFSVDGKRPQMLQPKTSPRSQQWNSSHSSAVLTIPHHASVVMASLSNSSKASKTVQNSHAHALLMVSQIMEQFSWADILSSERSRVSMTTSLVLIPGPVEGAASVLDEVQAIDAASDCETP